MLQWTYRFNVKPGKATSFRDWVLKNEQALRDHASPGWKYLGTWFSVRGFGSFDCEVRWEIESYGALGAGFGDEENQRLLNEFIGDFIDHTTRPEASLLRSASDVVMLTTS